MYYGVIFAALDLRSDNIPDKNTNAAPIAINNPATVHHIQLAQGFPVVAVVELAT
jgi:hypothetical protein